MDKDAKSEKEIIIDTLQGIKRKLKKLVSVLKIILMILKKYFITYLT